MFVSRSTVFYRKILYSPVIYRRLADKPKVALPQAGDFLSNPFVKQLAGGTACGLLAGYVTKHVGRTASICVGTGILAYEIAKYNGAVPANMDPTKMANDMGNKYGQQSSELMNKVKVFAGKNRVFTAAFVGGFLIGVAV